MDNELYLLCGICNAACRTQKNLRQEAKIVHASESHPSASPLMEYIYEYETPVEVIAHIAESGIIMEELRDQMIEDLEQSQGWGAQFN